MQQPQGKKRRYDKALVLLLLLLLFISISCMYYHLYPYKASNHVVIGGRKIGLPRSSVAPKMNLPENNNIVDTINGKSLIFFDTAAVLDHRNTDSTGSTERQEPDAQEVEEPTLAMETSDGRLLSIEELSQMKKNLKSVSEDDEVICLFDSKKKTLNVRPSRAEWHKVYLIYPNPEYRNTVRRNLIYPEFEGLVYPVYKKGSIVHNQNAFNAVSVKIVESATREHSYTIQAKSNPPFFIFGDYEDKNKWYIYENGKVRKFTPPADFDALITEKL